MSQRDLDGRRILITGGGRGIGHATVNTLLARGAAVATIDQVPLEQIWRRPVHAITADVCNERAINAEVDAAARALGGLDGVINNAGVMIEKALADMTAAEFDRVIGVNLRGTFLVTRAALPHLKRAVGGADKPRIVNIASELAYIGRAEATAYCASKGGVISLTRALAHELAPEILVNAVAPGPTDTDMLRSERNSAEQIRTGRGVVLGRVGHVDEVASMIAVMLGPDSRFMTGQTIGVNGGALMH